MKPHLSRSSRLCFVLAGFVGLIVAAKCANAQTSIPSFSAYQIHTMRGKVTTGKVYANENAVRTEGEQKAKQSISIMRLDKKVLWNLVPDQKMYIEMPFVGSADVVSMAKDAKVEKEQLGPEQVGAYHCDKYRWHTTLDGKVYTGFEWDAKELNGFPVKRAGENADWSVEYQNVRLGPQDPSLFEIPAGYQKLSLGGLMRQPNP